MKKKCNVIQINGFSGVFLAVFLICCAATGFIVFPAWCCMHIWNFLASFVNFPVMNIYNGGILWIIIALVFFVTHGKEQPIQFSSVAAFEREDVKKTIELIQPKTIENLEHNECENENSSNITKEN